LQNAILATVGHRSRAINYAMSLSKDVFESAGGNGHSLTNTIWYYSTRPDTEPLPLPEVPSPSPTAIAERGMEPPKEVAIDCGCPKSCSSQALSAPAGGYTCGMRIHWLMQFAGKSEHDACSEVGGIEFPDDCGACDPQGCVSGAVITPAVESTACPPCSKDVCKNPFLNRCPILDAPFVCTEGANEGGCSFKPWELGTGTCHACCLLTLQCDVKALLDV